MPTSTTAFHPVSASRTFTRNSGVGSVPNASTTVTQSSTGPARISSDAPGPSTAERPRKVDWPQPLRRYVQRAFMPEHNVPGIGRVEMEEKLKETITEANNRNSLNTIDWDSLPLPQAMIQAERKQKAEQTMMARLVISPPWQQQQQQPAATTAPVPGNHTSRSAVDSSPEARKRKSTEVPQGQLAEQKAAQLPWRKGGDRNVHESGVGALALNSAGRPGAKSHRAADATDGKHSSKFQNGNNAKRQKRVGDATLGAATFNQNATMVTPEDSLVEREVAYEPVVGRSQALEKQYFRLTAAPNPDTVRPLAVLQKTLQLLKTKWKEENNYLYICDQFKSLRQDLTVQHIKNEFTVHVYEIHARIALEKGDLGEYNQCQTQLRALYARNIRGRPMEFKAYHILYLIHTGNRTGMNNMLADLTPAEKEDPAVKHALDVRSALALGNYHKFFRLYLASPNMSAYLIDMFVGRERLAALACICRAYRPDIRLRFITEELGFESDHESLQFLTSHGAQHLLEMRDNDYRFLTSKAGSLFEEAKAEAFRRVDIKGQL